LRFVIAAVVVLVILIGVVIWPHIDLVVSGWFYRPGEGFFLRDAPLFDALHFIAHAGSRILGFAFVLLALLAASQRRPVMKLNARAWLFLFLGLLLGAGLVANGIFKDHWGRARPREVTEFGGTVQFSPALIPADQCRHNCSFVAGDAAFGFFLPAFAYVAPPARRRRVFWGGMGMGVLFGLARLAAGAHFLSDVIFAAVFMQGVLAALYRFMYGAEALKSRWREWAFLSNKSTG
jgi:lipid A 4'-phosphatase